MIIWLESVQLAWAAHWVTVGKYLDEKLVTTLAGGHLTPHLTRQPASTTLNIRETIKGKKMFGIFQAFLDVHNEKIEYVTNISTDVSAYCGYFCYSIDIGKFIRCYRIIELEMCLVMIIQC